MLGAVFFILIIMPVETRKYTNNEVTVVWKPGQCIHSKICWTGLQEVFDPKKRPWVNIEGASTERIIEQVRHCPSGALSYYMNDAQERVSGEEEAPVAEAAQLVKVSVTPNGPYILKTECVIQLADGREEIKKGTVALCRCGSSNNKPYCDGRHREINFQG